MANVMNKESLDCFVGKIQKGILDYYCAGNDDKKLDTLSMVSQNLQGFIMDVSWMRIDMSALTAAVMYYCEKNGSEVSNDAKRSLKLFMEMYSSLQNSLPMMEVLSQALNEWQNTLEKEEDVKEKEEAIKESMK